MFTPTIDARYWALIWLKFPKIRWGNLTVGVVDVTEDCDHQFKKSLMLTANEIGIYHNDGLVIPKNFRFSDEEVRSELSSIVAIAHFFNPSMTDTPFGGVPAEVA